MKPVQQCLSSMDATVSVTLAPTTDTLCRQEPALQPRLCQREPALPPFPEASASSTHTAPGFPMWSRRPFPAATSVPQPSFATATLGVRRFSFHTLADEGSRGDIEGWGQSLRSCTGSRWGHSSWTGSRRVCSIWTGNSRVCSSWTGNSRAGSSWTGNSRVCSSWTGNSRVCSSWTGSSRAGSSWTDSRMTHSPPWSPHRSHSPPWSPHRSHSLPWSPHRSHSPPWSPHRSHSLPWSPHRTHSPLCQSWSRNRLAHSSTRACSSRQGHSSWSRSPHSQSRSPHSRNCSPHSQSCSPHSWSRSPHSWSRSPHSRSRSPRNSQSSPWFSWVEEEQVGGADGGAGERRMQVWSSLSLEPLYPCPGVLVATVALPCSAEIACLVQKLRSNSPEPSENAHTCSPRVLTRVLLQASPTLPPPPPSLRSGASSRSEK
ncbi:LOW QUALITY PROTEIN: uncharacterized protein [Eulemur rufifrons]|uniref:LOW QUALITY PROTEIN: uncharacterized protein n=1 Tax=Eulemur rufifrons TaxID=859984 RepID=UPI0037447223